MEMVNITSRLEEHLSKWEKLLMDIKYVVQPACQFCSGNVSLFLSCIVQVSTGDNSRTSSAKSIEAILSSDQQNIQIP